MQASSAIDMAAGGFLSPDGSAVSATENKRAMSAPDATAAAASEESEEVAAARTGGGEAARRVEALEAGGF